MHCFVSSVLIFVCYAELRELRMSSTNLKDEKNTVNIIDTINLSSSQPGKRAAMQVCLNTAHLG